MAKADNVVDTEGKKPGCLLLAAGLRGPINTTSKDHSGIIQQHVVKLPLPFDTPRSMTAPTLTLSKRAATSSRSIPSALFCFTSYLHHHDVQ